MLRDYYVRNFDVRHEPVNNAERKGKLDLLILRYMTRRLHVVIRQLGQATMREEPQLYMLPERHQRKHRVLLYKQQELLAGEPLIFVGFISHRQKDVDPSVVEDIQRADEAMLAELAASNSNIEGIS